MVDLEKPSPVKPADALGTLSRRAQAFRMSYLLAFVVGFVALAFFAGLIVDLVTGEGNTPEVPSVEL